MKNKKHDENLTQGRTPEHVERNEKVATITAVMFVVFIISLLIYNITVYGI
jgi:hypothetical protein